MSRNPDDANHPRSFLRAGLCFALCSLAAHPSANAQTAYANAAECVPQPCGANSSANVPANPPNAAQSRAQAAAAAFNAIQNNLRMQQQIVNTAGAALFNFLSSQTTGNPGNATNDSNQGDDSADPDSASASAAAAAAAQRRTQLNAEAAQILQDSAQAAGSVTPADASGSATAPDASAAMNALLGPAPASGSSNATINALLGSSSPQSGTATTTASTIAELLDTNQVSDGASGFAPTALPTPSNPQFNDALQDSSDPAAQGAGFSVQQVLASAGQQIKDQLTGIADSATALLSTSTNNPTARWLLAQGWNGTTAPLPAPTDSQETATNLTIGQATVGLGDILEGMSQGPAGIAKGLYSYGEKMVNQAGAYLGLAFAPDVNDDAGGSN